MIDQFMATAIPAQTNSIGAVIVAASVLVICCVCVALMMKSRRQDGKMLFLLGLISAPRRAHERKFSSLFSIRVDPRSGSDSSART